MTQAHVVNEEGSVKSMLNRLNRAGWPDRKVAEDLGLNKSSVSRRRSGAKR